MPKSPRSRKAPSRRKAKGKTSSARPRSVRTGAASITGRRGDGPVESPASTSSFRVVGIGASAGGLEAFGALLAALPSDTGMAFVLIQHMDPNHESFLQSLLQKATSMPVLQVVDGMAVQPNHVYVIPPNTLMTIAKGSLTLTPRRGRIFRNLPIDHFFESMAADMKSFAIGVILSGVASDGVEGLKAIKAEGGVTFAQDHESARHSGMPLSAVAAGCVDFTLPPDRIAAELVRISRRARLQTSQALEAVRLPQADADGVRRICALLRSLTGVEFALYKQATIVRRVARRMAVRKMDSTEQYVQLLQDDRNELKALYEDILIHVTGFFRDPEVGEALQTFVISRMLARQPSPGAIRVWAPGCSSGEEVYTIAILLLERLEGSDSPPRIQIFGTDISEKAIEQARLGIYAESRMENVSRERRRRFFSKVRGGYQVVNALRETCVFAQHDLARDPPFSRIDLLSCRNILIYMAPLLQKRVIENLHYALQPDGFLLLGKAESLGAYPNLFAVEDPRNKIFSRVESKSPSLAAAVARERQPSFRKYPSGPASPAAFDARRETERVLLDQYAPAALVVDADLRIIHFQGNTGQFLAPATGEPSFHLLRLARPEFLVHLRTAIQQVKKDGVTVRKERVPFRQDGVWKTVDIHVSPVAAASPGSYFLVVFHDPVAQTPADSRPRGRSKERRVEAETERLYGELDSTREQLRSIVQDHERAIEELRAMNEEVLSGNEELQSTNEELETAKEEIESSNEELHTLNDELQNRNVELSQLSDDLSNLLIGARIPIVFLDAALCVRRFTPAAGEVLGLMASDIGRPIAAIAPALAGAEDLGELAAEVIERDQVVQREVRDRGNHWFQLRIRPFKSEARQVDGALMALLDVDALKRRFDEAREAREFADAIVDTVREPLVVLDANIRVVRATKRFYETFQVSLAETEGRVLYTLGDGQWDVPRLRELLEDILPRDSHFEDFELEHEFASIGYRFMVLNARRIQQGSSASPLILLAIEDATHRKLIERERLAPKLEAAQEEERGRIARELHDGLIQELAGMAIDMGGYAAGPPDSRTRLAKTFRSLQSRVVRAAEVARRVAYELYPSEIDDLGLEVALRSYIEEFGSREGVAVRYHSRNIPPDLHRKMTYCLYRVAQEALRNIARHARATQAAVTIEGVGQTVRLAVEDSGAGFSVESLALTSGLGILSMRERLKAVGGKFSIDSQPQKGTRIVAEIPLRGQG